MRVTELIAKLQALPPTLSVILSCEDSGIVEPNELVRLFEVNAVGPIYLETSRDGQGRVRAAITDGEDKRGRQMALIEITVDF